MEDEKIKEYFSKDKIVSDKANKVFDNFIEMVESKNQFENKNETINTNKQDSSDDGKVIDFEKAKNKSRLYSFRKLISIAATLVVVFVGSNAYAHTRGYDNIFFLLKEVITQKSASGNDEIFSDRDIVISYQSFTITDGVDMQVNEIQAIDNNAKLYLLVKESKDTDVTPLYYKVFSENDEMMFDGNSTKDEGENIYTEVLNLSNFSDNTNSLKLEIYNKNKVLLKTVNIDLEEKTLEARTENVEIKKISQIELNKFLKEETQKIYTPKEMKDREIIILDIYDIYFSDSKFVVKYLFMKPTKEEFEKEKVEESDIYLNQAEFEFDNNEFRMIEIAQPEIF